MSLLSVKNVSKSYGLLHVLENIIMDVQPGDRIGLIGPNGAGKSTLVKIIAGEEEPDHGTATISGDATMSYAAQQPRLDLSQTVRQQVELVFAHVREIEHQMQLAAEELARDPNGPEHDAALKHYDRLQHQFQHLEGWDIQRRVQMVLEQLGFTADEMEQPVAKLSGGQKSRIQLARMLLEGADLLLLDEPTNHLDIPMLNWLENTLSSLDDTAMIIVSHDRYFLDRVVNRVIDLRAAGIDEYAGNYSAYMTQRAERLLTQQRAYAQQQAFIAKQEEYIRRFSAGQRAMQARGRKTRLERFKNESAMARPVGDSARMLLNLELDKPSGLHVLKLRDLSKAFGAKILFQNLTLELTRGDRLGVVGPNGSGKSTLLNILAGKQDADAGEMVWGHGATVQYFQQEHQDLNPDNTVMEEIHSVKPVTPPQNIRELAALFLFSGDDIFKKVGALSGGEKARVAMAKMLLKPANVILMDEPTNHLDMNTCEVVEAALDSYDGTLIVVSHDRYFLQNTCDRILAMEPDATVPGAWRLVDGSFDHYVLDREKRARSKAAVKKAAAAASVRPVKQAPPPKVSSTRSATAGKPKLPWHLEKLSAAELEKMIQTKEQELRQMETQFGDPAIAAAPDKLKEHQLRYEKLQTQIADAMTAWERKATR
ncbi:MAG: ABC-F family ATP-binding cassette domain-containing protein [Phycisphaerae bacterium]